MAENMNDPAILAGVIVAGAIGFLVVISVIFKGHIHY